MYVRVRVCVCVCVCVLCVYECSRVNLNLSVIQTALYYLLLATLLQIVIDNIWLASLAFSFGWDILMN